MTPALPMLVDALPDGVSRVSLPTPFRVGRVNCYVLLEPPVTVVDPGTLQPGSLAELRSFLKSHRLDLDDIEQIIVTHHHADHCGAAAVLAVRSGARIVCADDEVASLIEPTDVQSRRALLASLGVPDAMGDTLISQSDAAVARVSRRPHQSMITSVRDGDELSAGGRSLRCVVTPGHSAGHLSLWEPTARVLFSGDHLLARIIPAPSLDAAAGRLRRRSLVEYLVSLDRFVALDPNVVLPGHGRAFTGVDVLATRLRTHSAERADQIATLLSPEAATPFEIAHRLQWHPEGTRLALGLAHAVGHLDLLEQAGRAMREDGGAAIGYLQPR